MRSRHHLQSRISGMVVAPTQRLSWSIMRPNQQLQVKIHRQKRRNHQHDRFSATTAVGRCAGPEKRCLGVFPNQKRGHRMTRRYKSLEEGIANRNVQSCGSAYQEIGCMISKSSDLSRQGVLLQRCRPEVKTSLTTLQDRQLLP